MARSLAEQIELLRTLPGTAALLTNPPAWAAYRAGPWPTPHDPIFDFTSIPAGYAWLDNLAEAAAWVLVAGGGEAVIVGLAAGSYIAGHTAGQEAPTPAEAAAFVADYEDSRAGSFTRRSGP